MEFDFWYNLHKRINKTIEGMGYKFIEDEYFPSNKSDSIDIIDSARRSKVGKYHIDYLIGYYKKYEVRLLIGNTGYDNHIYASLAI